MLTNKLLDALFAGTSFGFTYGLAQLLAVHMPGVAAWFISGAVVCLAHAQVLELVFGSADEESADAE